MRQGEMRLGVILWMLMILLAGCCTSGLEPKSQREMEQRVYPHDYTLVYEAVRAVLTAKRYPIKRADPDLGLLESDWLVEKYARTQARAEIKPLGRHRTQVWIGIQLEEKGFGVGKWKPKKVSLRAYEELFEYIDVQIYREYFHRIERPAREGKPVK